MRKPDEIAFWQIAYVEVFDFVGFARLGGGVLVWAHCKETTYTSVDG